MTEPAHLRRYIRSTPRHSDLRLVGGVESGIERPEVDEGAAGDAEAAGEVRAVAPASAPAVASDHKSVSAAADSAPAEKPARQGLTDTDHWRGRWHDLLGRVRRRLEAGEDSGE